MPAAWCSRCLAQQVPIVAAWIAERRREGVAFAVLGDFNRRFGPREEMWLALNQAAPVQSVTEGFANPCWARSAAGGAGTQGSGGRPFIDHILLGGEAQKWWRRDSLKVMVFTETEPRFRDMLSDHCPVSIQVTLP